MTEARDTAGRESPMIRLCINCDTENPADAVICSECGMSLTRAPVGETAEKARSVAGVRDDADAEAKRIPRATLAALGVWTFLLVTVGLCCGSLASLASDLIFTGSVFPSSPGLVLMGNRIIFGASALALAPWVALFLQRWWRSRASEGPEDTKQDAG